MWLHGVRPQCLVVIRKERRLSDGHTESPIVLAGAYAVWPIDMPSSWVTTDTIKANVRSVTLDACPTDQKSLRSLERIKLKWPVKASADGVISPERPGTVSATGVLP